MIVLVIPSERERASDIRHRMRKDRDARALEAPTDAALAEKARRLAQIRAASEALASRQAAQRAARPSLGYRNERKPRSLPALSAEFRLRRLNAAIAFLRAAGVLVTVCDRDALVRQYRVSGKRDIQLGDDVVAIAVQRGFEANHG